MTHIICYTFYNTWYFFIPQTQTLHSESGARKHQSAWGRSSTRTTASQKDWSLWSVLERSFKYCIQGIDEIIRPLCLKSLGCGLSPVLWDISIFVCVYVFQGSSPKKRGVLNNMVSFVSTVGLILWSLEAKTDAETSANEKQLHTFITFQFLRFMYIYTQKKLR